MNTPARIGVPQADYNVNRSIVGSLPPWLRRVRPIDRHRIVKAIRYRCGWPSTPRQLFSFSGPYLIDCELFHFFNTITDVRRPWITTFETSLPRWGNVTPAVRARGLRLLGSEWCRRLIALSDAAKHIATSEWEAGLSVAEARPLCGKVEVLLPPQAVLESPAGRQETDEIRFAFVGADFYRKGGLEMLEAFRRLETSGVSNWRAVVVGNLDTLGDYAAHADESSRQRARDLLAAMATRIEYHRRLPYPRVLETMKAADYYLLPTLADTFGYGVLEAQACGAVAITTNVRALPEVVTADSGHVIELPLDDQRNAHTLPGFAKTRAGLTDALETILRHCCAASPQERLAKATAATANLRSRHDPAEHRRRLEIIYRRALEAGPGSASG